MINHIDISDFAIIKDLSVDFHPGLNIVTGETGAGKSIIIEAVSMALGSRADSDYVRTGSDKAVISMLVDWESPAVAALLSDEGIADDNPLVIRREISAGGKSLCRVNGDIVPLSVLSRLCQLLADIHGQYDHQSLLNPDNHINVLDLFGGEQISALLEKTSEAYTEYAAASTELMKLRKTLADSRREKELLAHELSEITAANIRAGECAELEEEIRLMENSETIYLALSNAYEALYGDGSADSALGKAMNELESVSGFSSGIEELSKTVSDAYYMIDELSSELRKTRDNTSFSQDELDSKIERLELLNGLKRKFGGSEEAVLEYAADASEKLSVIENADERQKELEEKILSSRAVYDSCAAELTAARIFCAEKLEQAVNKELAELNFNNAQFAVRIEKASIGANGTDSVEFLISANRGEAVKPLAKVASGGELSRIMLALKRITGDLDGIPTMIFDEIDTGISGMTAGIVGRKLQSISKGHQVICITHLPQIACLGDYHYKIEKTSDAISTSSTVVPLSEDERIEELARLLSGTVISESAREQARALISEGRN